MLVMRYGGALAFMLVLKARNFDGCIFINNIEKSWWNMACLQIW